MSARYRKIDPRIWNDEKFRTLSDNGKLAFLFPLHPRPTHMTALGAMRGTIPGLAAELGWTTHQFQSALKGCLSQGIVEACEKASWIGIPNFLRYNEPAGPNAVTKAWVSALDLLPECTEKRRLIQRCRTYLSKEGAMPSDMPLDMPSGMPSGMPESRPMPYPGTEGKESGQIPFTPQGDWGDQG